MVIKSKSGFTIVELLIVIVVIGILAAITIVAYNGIQQRARNTQVIAGVKTYQKAFIQYATVHGAYPTESGCLGANYPDNQCWIGDSGTHSTNAALDAKLSEFLDHKPTLATERLSISIGNNMRAGARYYTSTSPPRITYYLQGADTKCIDGKNGGAEGNMKQCTLILPAL